MIDRAMTAIRFGILGTGTMGRALARNLADRGHDIAVADADPAKARAIEGGRIAAFDDAAALLASLGTSRALLMMVPAGEPVDAALAAIRPALRPGDIIIDGGNSHPDDTERRASEFGRTGIDYLGFGISGGEAGARHGPSIMAGGSPTAIAKIAPLFESAAAKVAGRACFAHVGPAAAGHLVKTIHNGIEYAEMQLLAEAWILMRDGMALGLEDIRRRFGQWRESQIGSFLVEAAHAVLAKTDSESGRAVIDLIADRTGQKGTGAWASELALRLGVAAPTLAAAVFARNLSTGRSGAKPPAPPSSGAASETLLLDLEGGLLAAKIAAFAQGFAVIDAAGRAKGWTTERVAVARVWQGGCIIRAKLLERIVAAFERAPGLGNLVDDPAIAEIVSGALPALRRIVSAATLVRLPVPALGSALAWFEGRNAPGVGADLIAAQRDYFGAHGFERVDRPGRHHFDWKTP